jgi:nitrite reductase/ring-hydroxylating ferredoxin subunit
MPDPIAPFLKSTATTRRRVLRAAGLAAPCHGSKYSIEDGSVVNPPAPAPLEVTVSGGQVVVNAQCEWVAPH